VNGRSAAPRMSPLNRAFCAGTLPAIDFTMSVRRQDSNSATCSGENHASRVRFHLLTTDCVVVITNQPGAKKNH